MRIVHVITDLQTGGAEIALKRLIQAQATIPDLRHEVISLRSPGAIGVELQASGVPVEALGMRSLADLPRAILRLTKRFRQTRPDIVHTWMYHADLLGGFAARLAGVRNVIWGVRIAEVSRDMGVP